MNEDTMNEDTINKGKMENNFSEIDTVINNLPNDMFNAFVHVQVSREAGNIEESVDALSYIIANFAVYNNELKKEIKELRKSHEISMDLIADLMNK